MDVALHSSDATQKGRNRSVLPILCEGLAAGQESYPLILMRSKWELMDDGRLNDGWMDELQVKFTSVLPNSRRLGRSLRFTLHHDNFETFDTD